jgi:hypothetical protein
MISIQAFGQQHRDGFEWPFQCDPKGEPKA